MKQMKTICKKISVSILTLLMIMTMYLSGSGESLFLKNRDVKAFTGKAKLVMSQALSSNKISEIDRPASEGLWSMTADGHRVFCLNSGKTMCSGDTLKYKTINAATYEKKGIAKAFLPLQLPTYKKKILRYSFSVPSVSLPVSGHFSIALVKYFPFRSC